MVKRLSEINKTAFFAWSPGQQTPLIAAGTAAGAFDDSFSNASELELFKLDIKNSSSNNIESVGKISCASRFNKLVWGYASTDKPYGIIAGGLDNNELCLWDPSKMMDGDNSNEAKMMSNSTHTGEIRGLDFNKFQNNLLASAGSNNEVYIWDLTNPNTPYTPGPKSQKLEDITSVGWNGQVQHILATSSATGHTVVWDLRNRKEVMTLSAPNMGGINASRRSISSVVWHPDVATQLVTASEDDSNPVVTLWDLRHAHSPEKVLAGHTKGVLGISWCRQDSDLLMSCGKDCKTLIWNPNSGELLGELTQDSNYTFQTEWCPRNPDLLASASFDGKISVYSLQNSESEDNKAKTAETVNEDPFSAALNASAASTSSSTFALRHPPKWLRCPVGASFGFGGKLVSFNNKANHLTKQAVANAPPGQASAPQIVSRTVQVNTIVTDKEMIQRSDELEAALEQQSVEQLVEERIQGAKEKDNKESWEVIKTLLAENAREQLMNYLGFQKAEIVAAVEKITANKKGLNEDKPKEEEKEEAAISPELTTESAEMEETEKDKVTSPDEAIKPDEPSEEKQDTEDVQEESGDKAEEPKLDETTTDNSASNLFGDDNGDNFFIQSDNTQAPVEENTDNRDTAAAVTKILGSAIKHEPLQLYSEGSSETDSLITRAVVLGDFESAVNLCLSTERFSDALLFAICGGGDLLARTQQAYFKHQSRTTSYLRLLESIIDEDLQSIVASVSLEEWTSVIVVLCTFAKAEDFKPLCEALGARLEEGWNNSETESAKEFRRHATLCYLAAGNIEKIARIWIAEQEEEVEKTESESIKTASLQDLIEKITIFRKVIAFEDPALFETNENKLPYEFPLAPLYDKYCEYAELLASQGKLTTALSYLSLTPIVYRKAVFDKLSIIRDRIYQACPVSVTSQYTQPAVPFEKQSIDAKVTEVQAQTQAQPIAHVGQSYAQPQTQPFQQSYQPYQPTAVSANPPPPSVQPTYGAVRSPLVSNTYTPVVNNYTPATNTYTPTAPPASNYAPSAVPTSSTTYAPPTATGAPTTAYQPQTTPTNATSPSYGYNQPANNFNAGYNNVSSGYPPAANTYGGEQYSNSSYNATRTTIPPPPPPIGGVAPTPRSMSQESTSTPIKKAEGAWNDPPMNIASKKIRSPKIGSSPAKRVTSPFPNQPAAAAFVNPTQQSARMPPPPQGTIPPPPMSRGPPPPMGPPRGGMPPMQQQQQQRPMAMGHQQPITQMAPPMGMAQAPPPRANPLPPPPMNAAAPVPLAKRGPPPQGGYYQQK